MHLVRLANFSRMLQKLFNLPPAVFHYYSIDFAVADVSRSLDLDHQISLLAIQNPGEAA